MSVVAEIILLFLANKQPYSLLHFTTEIQPGLRHAVVIHISLV